MQVTYTYKSLAAWKSIIVRENFRLSVTSSAHDATMTLHVTIAVARKMEMSPEKVDDARI